MLMLLYAKSITHRPTLYQVKHTPGSLDPVSYSAALILSIDLYIFYFIYMERDWAAQMLCYSHILSIMQRCENLTRKSALTNVGMHS